MTNTSQISKEPKTFQSVMKERLRVQGTARRHRGAAVRDESLAPVESDDRAMTGVYAQDLRPYGKVSMSPSSAPSRV